MILLDKERNLIEERIQKIIEARETAPSERKIVIAGNIPVLEEHEKEMKALKDMLKIIDNNFRQDHKTEYLDLRDVTKLPELNEKDRELYTSTDFQRKEELRKIETRMNGIATKYFSPTKPTSYQKASDGREINTGDIQEYENYLKMKDILYRGMDSNDYYEYFKLREKTRMVPMSEGQYEVLMGKTAPFPYEKSVVENKEEGLAVRSPEMSSPNEETSLATVQSNLEPDTNDHNYDDTESIIDVPNLNEQTPTEQNIPELPPHEEVEELEEVTKVSLWDKIKKHKKAILIGLGLTAIAISAVVVITQLMPAIVAASQASQIAGLAGQMVSNGTAWWTATAGEQAALHGANTALANAISGMTGAASNYTASTGVWTIAGQALPQFLNTSIATATAAAGKVTLLQAGSALGIVGGLGSLGAGLIPSKDRKKSSKYYELNNSIEKLKSNIKSLNGNDQTKLVQSITNKIIEENNISEKEREILFRKLRKLIKKSKMQNSMLDDKSVTQDKKLTESLAELREQNSSNTILTEEDIVNIERENLDKKEAIDVDYTVLEETAMARSL